MDEVRLEIAPPIATIKIYRPLKRNALNQAMWDALADAVERAASDERMRAIVLASAVPGVFSAGADIDEYRRFAGDVDWGLASQARVARALTAIASAPVPTLAAIDGACVGGGSGIALACDFRIASTTAFFSIPAVRLGLVFPHEFITALLDLVGPSAAKRILLTGRRFDADWALQVGFVDEIHPPAELDAVVSRWVEEIVSVAPGAVRATKAVIALTEQGIRQPTAETERLVEAALASADHREGVAAFLEGRAPDFTRLA
jgi:enoyl-CoA hydratase/carnithine racemase